MLFMEETVAVENLYPSGSKREEIEEKFKNTIHEELKLGVLSPYMCDNMKKLCTSGSKRFLAKKEVHVCIIWGLISIKSILFQLL